MGAFDAAFAGYPAAGGYTAGVDDNDDGLVDFSDWVKIAENWLERAAWYN